MKRHASHLSGQRPLRWILLVSSPAILAVGCADPDVEVRNTPPVPSITAPTDGQVLLPGQVQFHGAVADQQEHDLSRLVVTWVITRQSEETRCAATPTMDGLVTCTRDLEAGSYVTELEAIDTSGLSARTQISFTLLNGDPVAEITSDDTAALEGDPVFLEGTVSDPESSPDELTVLWASDLDGTLGLSAPTGSGYVSLSTNELTPGYHLIRLAVTDPLGATAFDEMPLTVQACPDDDGDGSDVCERPGIAADCDDADADAYPENTERCDGRDNDCDDQVDEGFDQDGDGVASCTVGNTPADCNDSDGDVFPGATEHCNGIDDNCNGQIDEETDADNDGVTPCGGDCDDGSAAVYAGALELCDGLDNDCDDRIDEGFDQDNDGITSCGGDCNDQNAAINPSAVEGCNRIDDDCDGQVDDGFDVDGDSYTQCGATPDTIDCNDGAAAIHPGASEVCNKVDDDCDAQVDEEVTTTFYRDIDGDGYGSATSGTLQACSASSGYVSSDTDCNDADTSVHPGATESCNARDDDCDGTIDDGFDADSDGYTGCGSSSQAADCDDADSSSHPFATEQCDGIDNDCDGQADEGFDQDGDGYTQCDDAGADCDDGAAAIHPGASESCDGADNDCDGNVDEGFDADQDGYSACQGVDCDDARGDVHPGAPETCNARDDDCDGRIDEGFDQDTDGYTSCGSSSVAADCNDSDPSAHPGATESCDGRDNDCDGSIDEGLVKTWYADNDEDGFGSSTATTQACSQPLGFVSNNQDCDDSDGVIYPGAPEGTGADANGNGVIDGDGKDNDCDGATDEGTDRGDDDQDGYTENQGDCDDADADLNPAELEGTDLDQDGLPDPDGIDNDCDGRIDDGTVAYDDDLDGYSELEGDCDDADPLTWPTAPERFDGVDNDCDGDLETEIMLADAFSYAGSQAGGQAGFSLAGPGDLDGDGFADLVIGAPEYNTGKGAVQIVYGRADWADDRSLSTGVTLTDEADSSHTGYALTPAGDMNGDGFADFAVGAPFYDYGLYSDPGVAYVIMGDETRFSGGLVNEAATSAIKGIYDGVYVGAAVAGGGDVNGDGIDDLLIGGPWPTGYSTGAAGWIMILAGMQTGWTGSINMLDLGKVTGRTNEALGTSVAIIGHFDGDGYDDILMGGQYDTTEKGDAWLATGRSGFKSGGVYTPSNLNDYRYYGSTDYEFIGYFMAGAGDVNFDGYDEFLLGRQTDGNGTDARAYLHLGPTISPAGPAQTTADVKFTGSSADHCPCSVAGVGDLDGDGYDDIAIGVAENRELSGGGKIYLFYGGPGATISGNMPLAGADMTFYAEASGDGAGYAIAAAHDLNGDGYDDFVVGAPYNDQAGTDAGKVYVLLGFPRP